jgi:hypothetical protein
MGAAILIFRDVTNNAREIYWYGSVVGASFKWKKSLHKTAFIFLIANAKIPDFLW